MSQFRRLLGGLLLLSMPATASAVIVPGVQQRNTAAPSGTLANAGWQWQGRFGGFLGTPIGPKHFLTAKHIGHGVGTPLIYKDSSGATVSYPTVAQFLDPNSDLRILEISGTFDSWAPMWDAAVDGSEVGRSLFVAGRGTARGDEVFGPSSNAGPQHGRKPSELKGWLWGADDRVQSWGTNTVDGIVNGGTSLGELLYFDFDRNASDDEAMLSAGDSSGGVFIQNSSGQWKLAGVNYGAEFQFARTDGGPTFNAALFDIGGLYYAATNPDLYFPEQGYDQPAGSYSTRVSGRLSWINGVLNGSAKPQAVVPEPSSLGLLAMSTLLLRRRR